jgi:molybdate transport system ATP-binding protein
MPLIALKNLKIGENFLTLDFHPQHLYEITGPNGCGKSYLARVLCGKVFNKDNVTRNLSLTEISYTDFTADGSVFQYASSYYQERYQSGARVESIKVIDFLKLQHADPDEADFAQRILPARLLNQEMIELSSGETRKVLIAKTLLKPAKIYILDNPFTGLDAQSARDLSDFLRHFHSSRGCCLVVLTVKPHFEPAEDVLRIDLKPFTSRNGSTSGATLPDFSAPVAKFERVFDLRNAQIRAGEKILLSDVNWCIRKGEKWLLQGPNGSGKTTLTSLMYADNPNAYAQDLVVFDKKRGSGESIWQIKARIGFVSPEIQNFWPQSAKVIEVIRSGLSGTQVLVRRIQPTEQKHIEALLLALGLSPFSELNLGQLSAGEKKLVMIARALAHNPPVLILDEPFQGLDEEKIRLVQRLFTQLADTERTLLQIAHEESEILACIESRATIANGYLSVH